MPHRDSALFEGTNAHRLTVMLFFAVSIVLVGFLPLTGGQDGIVHVTGAWQDGIRPSVYVRALGNDYQGSVWVERDTTQTNVFLIKLSNKEATCKITLRGFQGEIIGSAQELAQQTNSLPEAITTWSEYKGNIVAHIKGGRWLHLIEPEQEYQVQRFEIRNIRVPEHKPTGYITVELVLYKTKKGDTQARLFKFLPLEIQLPPFGQLSHRDLPAHDPYPVDPNWANPERVAAVADLPVPSARWIPGVVWGIALAALLAAVFLRHRRRKRGTPPP